MSGDLRFLSNFEKALRISVFWERLCSKYIKRKMEGTVVKNRYQELTKLKL